MNTPSVEYWHLWTDSDGVSHQRRRRMDGFTLESFAPPAAAQWLGPSVTTTATTLFTVLPAGWVGEWHENPKPQWIVPLSGCWFVEAMDGTRAEMAAGELALGADQGCRERNGRCGHRSGTVGTEPAVLMIVQLDPASVPSPPAAASSVG